MKKILLSAVILVSAAAIAGASGRMYSEEYIKHLKDCSVHIEKYKAEIPTEDVNTPVLHLQSTETIAGWQNGKCITKSTVFSNDMNQDILITQCAFTEKQLASFVNKMEAANKGSDKDKQKLQDELTGYIKDNSICTVSNLLEGK